MVNFAFGLLFATLQLLAPGGGLPQVVTVDYPAASVAAGRSGEVVVSLKVRDGYLINHTPPMQLKLESVPGVALAETSLVSAPVESNSDDPYYATVPDFKVGVTPRSAGAYEVPGELVYFFCSKADGFCARQTLDVRVPIVAE